MYGDQQEWRRQRDKKMELAGNICEDCGKEAKHVHHKDEIKLNHDLDNLKALCCKCHRAYHPVVKRSARNAFHTPTAIGDKLRRARKDKALRMIDVHAATGITTATLTAIETGKRKNFNFDTIIKLADLYGKEVVINLEG